MAGKSAGMSSILYVGRQHRLDFLNGEFERLCGLHIKLRFIISRDSACETAGVCVGGGVSSSSQGYVPQCPTPAHAALIHVGRFHRLYIVISSLNSS
jgi:hypothetical protein